MKILLSTVFVSLSLQVMAFQCPESIEVEFGKILPSLDQTETALDQEAQALAGETLVFKKKSGVKVCRYTNEKFALTLRNYNDKEIFLHRGLSIGDNNYSMSFDTSAHPSELRAGFVNRSDINLRHSYEDFDEDGCAFGQAPCEPFDVDFASTRFSYISFKIGKEELPVLTCESKEDVSGWIGHETYEKLVLKAFVENSSSLKAAELIGAYGTDTADLAAQVDKDGKYSRTRFAGLEDAWCWFGALLPKDFDVQEGAFKGTIQYICEEHPTYSYIDMNCSIQ